MSLSEIVNNVVKTASSFTIPLINTGNRILNLADWCVLAAIVSQVSLGALALLAGTVTTSVFVANAAIFATQLAAPLILAHITIEALTFVTVTAQMAAKKFCHVR